MLVFEYYTDLAKHLGCMNDAYSPRDPVESEGST
jgi:hypothetical protein